MDIGDIIKRRIDDKIVFEWTIPEFFNLSCELDSFYYSPDFHCFQDEWYMALWTNGCVFGWDEDWIVICLWRRAKTGVKSLESPLQYTVGIKNAEGKELEILCNRSAPGGTVSYGMDKFVQWSELSKSRSQLAPSNAVTITISLWATELPSVEDGTVVFRETQTEDLSDGDDGEENVAHLSTKDGTVVSRETQTEDLRDGDIGEENVAHLSTKGEIIQQKHLKDMLLEGQDHDVTLKVKDQGFRAHKNILRARSPVFAAMFTHNMKEAECGDVTIEDCDPNAFGEFLEYVYSGKVDITPNNALGLYYVGDKYDFADLKETCVEFLKISLSTTVVSDVITLAMKHGEEELLNCATAFFTDHLMEILPTVEWQRFNKYNPDLANELNIKAMKSYYKKT